MWTMDKGFATFVTFVWFLPSMSSLRYRKTQMLVKGFAIFCTFTRSLPSVDSLMLSKKWIMGKGFATFCTLLNSAEMPCHMLYIYILAIWCEKLTHSKRPWWWERLKAGGEGDDRGWDGWMASLTQWTWVWVNSRSWWWTGRPDVLWFMGWQRVGHDWVTELNWFMSIKSRSFLMG